MLWSASSLGNRIISENILCCGFQISLEIIFMKNKNDRYIVFPIRRKKKESKKRSIFHKWIANVYHALL